jgi:SNF2 family DNA or RNA helicase
VTPTTITLTDDHRLRQRALAVPGAYWSREHKDYRADNPTPRAAAAIIALFPDALIEHPELTRVRDRDYGNARPHDYAAEVGLHLDVDLGGDVNLYDWQARDLGYLRAIAERDGGAFIGWDRGLGKTIATASLIKAFGAKRSLVVTRNDTKESVWQRELARVLPVHRLLVLPNAKVKRERLLDEIAAGKYDSDSVPFVLIVHYEALAVIAGANKAGAKGAGEGWKRLGRWSLMAFDEGHRLASYNPNSRKNTHGAPPQERGVRQHPRADSPTDRA